MILFSLMIYSTNNDQNYFLCLFFIIFSGLILSGPSLLSILLATEWHATEIPNLVPHVQLLGNLPFLCFFVPYRLPGIGFILSCTRPVVSLDLLYPEFVRCCMYSQFFLLTRIFGPNFLKIICTSASNTHICIIHLRRAG